MTESEPAGRSLAALVLAFVIGGIGLILAVGGAWLVAVGGSPYYVIAGLAMVVAAGLLFFGRPAGMWVYVAVFSLTVPWALWESGTNPWALVPRLVGPALLLAFVALLSPLVDRRTGWLTAVAGAVGSLVFLGVVIWADAAAQPDRVASALPPAAHPPGTQAVGADWPAWGGTNAGERFSTLGADHAGKRGPAQARMGGAHRRTAQRQARTGQVLSRDDPGQDRQSPLHVFGDERADRLRCGDR